LLPKGEQVTTKAKSLYFIYLSLQKRKYFWLLERNIARKLGIFKETKKPPKHYSRALLLGIILVPKEKQVKKALPKKEAF
jgi:hypothetical protein